MPSTNLSLGVIEQSVEGRSSVPASLESPPSPVASDKTAAPAKTPDSVYGFTAVELDQQVQAWGWPRFRAQQLRDWVYKKQVNDAALMTNLNARDKQTVKDRLGFGGYDTLSHQQSTDGTLKLLLGWKSDRDQLGEKPVIQAETVMIPDGDRRTACVSSQVGCPVGCKFCASGIGGVKGNLSAAQIVEQVVALNATMAENKAIPGKDERVTHLVFMGMGEPLANYSNLMQAIRVLHDPGCFNIGARKITVSTVGVPAKMRELAREELPINLAISLHAPNEALRKQLIPWAEHFALNDILDAGRYYFDQTGRELTLEYILLSGVNDLPEHARQLARLCRTLRANVNLIRYNEVAGLGFTRPKSQDVVAFQDILRESGVNAHVRKSRGRDIDAACGQLRRNQNNTVGVP